MAGRDLTYTVGVDASDAVSGLKKLDSTVKSTMKNVESELDDGATAGDKFAASIDQLSAQLKGDFEKSANAAKELQQALKNAGSTLDVGEAVSELSRMGFTFDEITADADKFAASLKQLDDVRLDGVKQLDAVAPGLATKLDDVQKSAGSSKSALANMVGNSAQDLGALGGIAGSTGVAVGQMAEYFADAAFEGEGLKSVIKNFASVAAPIAAMSVAMIGVQKVMSSIAETKAFDTAKAKAFADAIEEVGAGGRAVVKVLQDAQAVTGRAGGLFGTKALESTKDITKSLDAAGVSVDDFTAAVVNGGPALDSAVAKLKAMQDAAQADFGASMKEEDRQRIFQYADAIEVLKETHKSYADQLDGDESWNNWMSKGDAATAATKAWNKVLEGGIDTLHGTADALDDTATSEDNAARKARLLADKVAEFISQYDIMTGRISTSNAALDLADAFDAATEAAGRTYLFLKDHSPEAEAALREQARLQNDIKQKVIDYHDELGRLPPEVITRINALVDQGDLTKAEQQLTILTRNREANIRIIASGGAGYGPISGSGAGPRSVPMSMSGVPSSTQLAKQIGTVKVPIDMFVRSAPRITGIRE